jgi:hypothetical protein
LLDGTYDATLAAGSVVVEVGCKNDGAIRRDSFYIPEPKLRSLRSDERRATSLSAFTFDLAACGRHATHFNFVFGTIT